MINRRRKADRPVSKLRSPRSCSESVERRGLAKMKPTWANTHQSRHPNLNSFRGSIPSLLAPLSTHRPRPNEHGGMTRARLLANP